MVTINENLFGLVIAGPVALAFLAGGFSCWAFADTKRSSGAWGLVALILCLGFVAAVVYAVACIGVGFAEGVSK